MKLIVMREICPSPSIQRLPSHQAEDIGALLNVLSSLLVVISTT
jgi:hypothetical protein